ncbi:hypothetical protein HanOQP8_Chr00c023g0717331 [Helianthus annuus]|nr:hypothetical protein HanOQP8_Chr00c023g0717331 [Helianthus annuus]
MSSTKQKLIRQEHLDETGNLFRQHHLNETGNLFRRPISFAKPSKGPLRENVYNNVNQLLFYTLGKTKTLEHSVRRQIVFPSSLEHPASSLLVSRLV